MIAPHHTISPGSLRPRVEGDFANDRVKQSIMSRLFGEPLAPAKIGRFTVIRERETLAHLVAGERVAD